MASPIELLTVTPYGMARLDGEIHYHFPDAPNADPRGYPIGELFAMDTPTPKEAMHDPASVFTMWGSGIRAGIDIPSTTDLDIAPTLLTLMGIAPPAMMKGRVLREAWGDQPISAAAKKTESVHAQA
jgi:hypothetical protein